MGANTNDLRRFIFYANRGAVRSPHHDDQTTQAFCHPRRQRLRPATTGYLQDAIDAQRTDGQPVSDEAIAGLSPARSKPSTPTGP